MLYAHICKWMTSLQVADEMLWKDAPAGLKSFRQEKRKETEKREKRMCNLKGALAGS